MTPHLKHRAAFCKDSLPSPAAFYRGEFRRVSRPSRQGWALVRCCFHPKDRNASLSINVVSGGFNCFACGARGGDLVDFLMLRDGLDFKSAAQSLGAWSQLSDADALRIARQRAERQKQADLERQKEEEMRLSRIETRDELHLMERCYRFANRRLQELNGSTPIGVEPTSEAESCWQIMASALPLIRMDAERYRTLAGLEAE